MYADEQGISHGLPSMTMTCRRPGLDLQKYPGDSAVQLASSPILRFLGLMLVLTGCVPVQSTVSPVNIEGKTFKVELSGESDEESGEGTGTGTGIGPLKKVAGRICPQGFQTLEASSSWNPLNGRIYRYTVQCDDAARGL